MPATPTRPTPETVRREQIAAALAWLDRPRPLARRARMVRRRGPLLHRAIGEVHGRR